MKVKNNLYKKILNYDNALTVFNKIKRNYRNKDRIYNYSLNLNTNILNILMFLKDHKYKFGNYKIFFINDPKYRIIMSENINDKIVNHLVAKYILLDTLESKLIDTNVATRKEKGTKYAFNTFIKYINILKCQKKEIYVLKLDISKYFYNIDHEILLNKIKKYIKDKEALDIIKTIIESTDQEYVNTTIKNLKQNKINAIKQLNINDNEKLKKIEMIEKIPNYKKGKGLPIGNLTSQILAVFYMNDVDHYIKEELKFKYYIRYMDDLLILDTNKERLKEAFILINKEISKLNLTLNNKSDIYKLSNGISFLGYKFKLINNKYIEIRYNNQTIRKITKKLKKLYIYDKEQFKKSFGSYQGYLKLSTTNFKITFSNNTPTT